MIHIYIYIDNNGDNYSVLTLVMIMMMIIIIIIMIVSVIIIIIIIIFIVIIIVIIIVAWVGECDLQTKLKPPFRDCYIHILKYFNIISSNSCLSPSLAFFAQTDCSFSAVRSLIYSSLRVLPLSFPSSLLPSLLFPLSLYISLSLFVYLPPWCMNCTAAIIAAALSPAEHHATQVASAITSMEQHCPKPGTDNWWSKKSSKALPTKDFWIPQGCICVRTRFWREGGPTSRIEGFTGRLGGDFSCKFCMSGRQGGHAATNNSKNGSHDKQL